MDSSVDDAFEGNCRVQDQTTTSQSSQYKSTEADKFHKFSVVSLFNVLDRCDDPHALISDAKSRLADGGCLLIGQVNIALF